MLPAAAFHAQLSSIMEVLANTAVAEICDLVDNGYSVLQLEISRSRKENEVLRRKLRLMELRAARTAALRAAVTGGGGGGGGGALLCASGRARALLLGHHPGNDARRSRTPGGEVVLPRQTPQDPPQHEDPRPPSDSVTEPPQPAAAEAPSLSTALIKVEVVDESWSQSEHDKQAADAEAPPPVTKQETPHEGDDSSRSWASGEVSSTSTFVQKPVTSGQRSEGGGYECVMYEPQLQHGPHTTQNPLGEDPSCSYSVNAGVLSVSADSGDGGFPFSVTEVSLSGAEHQQPAGLTDGQQRAPPAADQPQPAVREEATGTQSAFIRRDRWRHQGGVNRASSHSTEEGRGKFVCSFCGKTLACLKNLKTHMRVHTGEKPFSCSLCGKCFSDSSNLKRHQNVHTGEKRYGCMHCGKRFAQSGSLKVHMTVHTDCKQFRCVYCGKTFISGTHLRRHITVHAGEKPLPPTVQ